MTGVVLTSPTETVPDLTTRGALLRFGRLNDAGFPTDAAIHLADAGYDVIGFAALPVEVTS